MKPIWTLSCIVLFAGAVKAQEAAPESPALSIVDRINRVEPGKGSVKIIQDEAIASKIGKPGMNIHRSSNDSYVLIPGWRIQVFSGNNQRLSKSEAFGKEAEVKAVFPDVSTYVKYTAPFWRLRVGDFRTYQSAQDMMAQLRHAFPAFGREMSIVKEKIQVRVP